MARVRCSLQLQLLALLSLALDPRPAAAVDLYIPTFLASQSGKAERVSADAVNKCDAVNRRDLPPRSDVLKTVDGADGLPVLERGGVNRQRWRTCAVVGNAGHLTGTKYGGAIDGNDAVIRMNQAPTQGYEDIVGAKTTIRVINKEWLVKYADNVPWLPWERNAVLLSRGDNEERVGRGKYAPALSNAETRRKVLAAAARNRVRVMKTNKRLVDAAWRKIEKQETCEPSGFKCPQCKPSSGFLAVAIALALCERVNVFGMAGSRFVQANKQYPYHYYNFRGTQLKQGYAGHAFTSELALIRKADETGVLRLCHDENAVVGGSDGACEDDSPCCTAATT